MDWQLKVLWALTVGVWAGLHVHVWFSAKRLHLEAERTKRLDRWVTGETKRLARQVSKLQDSHENMGKLVRELHGDVMSDSVLYEKSQLIASGLVEIARKIEQHTEED